MSSALTERIALSILDREGISQHVAAAEAQRTAHLGAAAAILEAEKAWIGATERVTSRLDVIAPVR